MIATQHANGPPGILYAMLLLAALLVGAAGATAQAPALPPEIAASLSKMTASLA